MTGRALKALNDAIARTLAALRIFAVANEVAVVVVWHSWYLSPAHLAVPVVAALWGLVFAAGCLRAGLTRRLVTGDFLVALLLAAAAPISLPPDAMERGPNWLIVRLVGTSIAVAWVASTRTWLLCVATLAGALAGSYATAGQPARVTLAAVVLMVVASTLLTGLSKLPRRSAVEADTALARTNHRRQALEVAALRDKDLRENERLLHDTMLNTLTGLGWGVSDPAEASSTLDVVRARCRHSVAVCTDFLAGAGDPEGEAGLPQRLAAVVAEARRDGLRVDAPDFDGPGPDGPGPDSPAFDSPAFDGHGFDGHAAGVLDPDVLDPDVLDPDVLDPDVLDPDVLDPDAVPRDARGADGTQVPTEVAAALAATAREALSNVRRHAGTAHAWLTVHQRDGEVWLTVRDEGRGFDPGTVPRDRLGLRNSVLERVADVGGTAEVRTTPGQGTTVVAHWSPRAAPASVTLADTALLEATYAADAVRTFGVAAAAWQLGLGLLLVSRLDHYRHPLVVAAAWLVPTLALAWCVRRARAAARTGPGLLAVVATGVVTVAVVAAQVVVGFAAPPGDRSSLIWVLLAGHGVICFLTVSRPDREWLSAATLVVGGAVVVTFLRHDAEVSVVTRVAGLLYALAAVLVAVAMFLRTRRATIGVVVRAAQAESELAAARTAAVAVRHDRQLRLRQLADGPLPLLADVGAGRLDPFDPVVRRDCARLASALRRTLTHTPTGPSLLGRLEPAVKAAERRGAFVAVQVAGDPGALPADLAGQVVLAADEALGRATGGHVLVTLLGEPTGGCLVVSCSATRSNVPAPRLASTPTAERPLVDVVTETADGRVCVEVRWGSGRFHPAVPPSAS